MGTKRILVSIGQISHVTMTISSFGSVVARHPEVSSNSDCMVSSSTCGILGRDWNNGTQRLLLVIERFTNTNIIVHFTLCVLPDSARACQVHKRVKTLAVVVACKARDPYFLDMLPMVVAF